MAWIYLAESAASLSPWPEESDLSPIVKTSDMPKLSYFQGWPMEPYRLHRSGTISELWVPIMLVKSTSSTEDSHAKTSALRALELAWKESEAGYSSRSSDSLARFDPDSFSWKTSQLSLLGGLTAFSWSSLRSGMIVDGRLYQPKKLEPRTSGNGGSFLPTPTVKPNHNKPDPREPKRGIGLAQAVVQGWPTPRASDCNGPGIGKNTQGGPNLRTAVRLATPTASMKRRSEKLRAGRTPSAQEEVIGPLNPEFVEWLMGYPLGWTALEDWAMQWFRNKPGKPSIAS